jgi:Protein of unknown function (DUF2786)
MTSPIIERIKKLLRLAADKRGNAHEAERALALAFELAEKHRIDMEGLDLDPDSERVAHEYFKVGERFDRLRRGVFSILGTFFHVSLCLCGPQMLVAGKPSDIEIARYVHDFLLRAGRDCLAEYSRAEKAKRRRVSTNKRAGFTTGFIWGISAKLGEARKAMPLTDSVSAIVLAEKVSRAAYVKEQCPSMKTLKALPDRKNETALVSGWLRGQSTNIHQPLGRSEAEPLLLGS